MTSISDRVRTLRARLAQRFADRRSSRPERLQRRTEAHARRLEAKRAHESDPMSRGGGGG